MTAHERMITLAQQMADGTASNPEAVELSALLRQHPEWCDEYLELQSTHAALCWEFRERSAESSATLPVERSTKQTNHPSSWLNRKAVMAWITSAAAIAIVAFFIGRWESSASASAATIIHAARHVHADAIERVYLVQSSLVDPNNKNGEPPLAVRVVTQGNSFYVEMSRDNRKWFWGRDDKNAFWITFGKRGAVRIEESELGLPLQYFGDFYSLELESLLDQIVKYCDIDQSTESSGMHIITATPRPRWRTRIRSVNLEIDLETKAVRRVTLGQSLPGRGDSTVTFTLVESRPLSPEKYRAEGHLSQPYLFLSRDSKPDMRRELLVAWFGPEASEWIKPESAH
jgi:hypothetical protein